MAGRSPATSITSGGWNHRERLP